MNNWKLNQILSDIDRLDKELKDLYSMKTCVFNSSMYTLKITGAEGRRQFGILYTPSRDITSAIEAEIQVEIDKRKAKRDALEARIEVKDEE